MSEPEWSLPMNRTELIATVEELRAELEAALSHEGEKDAQIEQLLEYLHIDKDTGAHRDWVADCQVAEATIDTLRRELADYKAKSLEEISELAAAEMSALRRENERLRDTLHTAERDLHCRGQEDAHYCPNCGNGLWDARERIRAALAQSAPVTGAGQMCHLCRNVHDLMSACPPALDAATQDEGQK